MNENVDSNLDGLRVLLLASIPEGVAGMAAVQDLYSAVVIITRRILVAGGHLVFGGRPSITPLICCSAATVERGREAITLYQAVNFRDNAPPEAHDPDLFPEVRWVGDTIASEQENLSVLREAMAKDSDAAILIGGRREGSLTRERGLTEEYRRFLDHHLGGPVYLVGLLYGEARRMAEEAAAGVLPEPNGLDDAGRKEVHFGRNLDVIAPRIAWDIASVLGGSASETAGP
jgi:hypothetical protein